MTSTQARRFYLETYHLWPEEHLVIELADKGHSVKHYKGSRFIREKIVVDELEPAKTQNK